MNQVQRVEEQAEGRNVVVADGASLMAVISRAASDPNTDVDKLERLLGMYERITAQQAKAAYTCALAELQPRLPVIDERGKTNNTTYAKWEDINDAIRPLLHEHGFALNFRVSRQDATVAVTGVLSHQAGHSEETTLELPVDTGAGRNAVQAVGSSVTYGKRYTAIALLNITSRAKQDRDDDGHAAGARQQSAACQACMTSLNAVPANREALQKWNKSNLAMIDELPDAEQKLVIRTFNARWAKAAA